jgi:C4-type Zn-finger protein
MSEQTTPVRNLDEQESAWVDSDYRCPKCGKATETAEVTIHTVPIDDRLTEAYEMGERCPHCKWQVDLSDDPKRVPYGTQISRVSK